MKRKRRRMTQKNQSRRQIKAGLVFLFILLIVLIIVKITGGFSKYKEYSSEGIEAVKPDIDVQLLDVNPYSRPGIKTEKIKNIVIHYTANPGSTAMENRNYFNGLKDSKITKSSSNFVVGLEGEIVQCVPTWEMAYASNNRNKDSVSIEFCHPDATGKPEDATYRSLVQLTAWLCLKFDLSSDDVIRHYDITGKICPKYYVDNEDEFTALKKDIQTVIEKGN